ncbi:mycothiol synthase [Cellulomonas sp. P22]|uniref:mycothiol synthase n=1 Tax=Cellulomonas sp. P22 TaxID=3373189 RepID=UPI0037AAC80B
MSQIVEVRGPLTPEQAHAVRELAAHAHHADGVAPLSEQPLLWLTAPDAPVAHLLSSDPHGTLLGYAQLDLGAEPAVSAELVVAPSARRQGHGRALLDRAGALAPSAADLRVWAHGDLPAARALAASAGLGVVRELWQMRLDLPAAAAPAPEPGPGPEAGPEPEPPSSVPGLTVRPFVPGRDEDAWLRVNARAFASHPEQGRMTRADLEAREAEPWFDPEGLLLAERDGVLVGSMWTKVPPPEDDPGSPPETGEIYALGIDPDAQGLGLGTLLTRLAVAHLSGRGVRTVELYVEGDNAPAIRTYSRAGFVRSAVDVMFGTTATEQPAGDTMGV